MYIYFTFTFSEKMHEIPLKVQTHLSKKEYLHATKLLVEAALLGRDSLDGIEGIKELKTEIEQKKVVNVCIYGYWFNY